MMTTLGTAHARAGLIGNPSDGFFGKTISIIVRHFTAHATCSESDRLTIVPHQRDRLEYAGVSELIDDVRLNGYYGGIRLIKAGIKRFADYCQDQGIELTQSAFAVSYDTDVPVRVGLGGSSAILTALTRALMQFHGVEIPLTTLPNLILSAETDELGIGAGLQDRVIQVFEGVVFMNFDREHMKSAGHGRYESLDPTLLPPLFVAYHDDLAEGTEVTHNDLHDRFQRGDCEVIEGMAQFADLAQQARDLIVAGRGGEIGPLMDANFDLRTRLCAVTEGNRRLVQIGRELGAAVKLAGSGGAVIGTYDGDPQRLQRLTGAYEGFGGRIIVPEI